MAADLLDQLAERTEFLRPGMKWAARWSSTGRGFRLHQTRSWEDPFYASAAIGDTPREALEKFFLKEQP